MSTVQEMLTVEAVTQYGIRSGGKNYSLSPRLVGSGITPAVFQRGQQIMAEVFTGPQGGKKINGYTPVGGQQAESVAAHQPMPPQYANYAPVPMPPALPPTTIAATPAPGGVAPVQAASNGTTGLGKVLANGSDDKMSKEDWKNKDLAIELVAVIKSSIESPALGEHVTGKSTPEFLAITREFVRYNLETLKLAKEGKL